MSEVGFTTPLFRRRLLQIWVGLVFSLFVSVIASNLLAKTCQDFHQPAEARMSSCARAWWVGLPRWVLEPVTETARYWLAYGAAYADLGQTDAAKDHFRRALRAVGLRFPVTLPDDLKFAHSEASVLLDYATRLPLDSAARRVLEEVLAEGR